MLIYTKPEFKKHFRKIKQGQLVGFAADEYWRNHLRNARNHAAGKGGQAPKLFFVPETMQKGQKPILDVEKTLQNNINLWMVDDHGAPVNLPGMDCPIDSEPAPETPEPIQENRTIIDQVMESAEDNDPDEAEDIPPIAMSNRMLTFQRARKTKAEADKLSEKSILIDEVVKKVYDTLRPLRDDLQLLAKKISHLVHAAESPHDAAQIIQKETDRILLSRIGGDYVFDAELKKKIYEVLTR